MGTLTAAAVQVSTVRKYVCACLYVLAGLESHTYVHMYIYIDIQIFAFASCTNFL